MNSFRKNGSVDSLLFAKICRNAACVCRDASASFVDDQSGAVARLPILVSTSILQVRLSFSPRGKPLRCVVFPAFRHAAASATTAQQRQQPQTGISSNISNGSNSSSSNSRSKAVEYTAGKAKVTPHSPAAAAAPSLAHCSASASPCPR